MDAVVCTSGINYFTRGRAQQLISETFRVLKSGGIARFSTQDLKSLTRRYVEKDTEFFFQLLPDGNQRFEGATLGDKFVAWFYGYTTPGGPCRYFYDYESLAHLFTEAGFTVIEQRAYRSSRLESVDWIDNRPEQMFFLEAVK
jgi:ubiquinone/menaquinone biosynthesis C-methylase UbiE